MIEVLPDSGGNILVLKTAGKLTDADYKDVLIPRLESIIRDHGKARILVDVGVDFRGWEPAAFWDDARFGITHRRDFEKLGVIGGPQWTEWGVKLATLIVCAEIRSFPAGERGEALKWIRA